MFSNNNMHSYLLSLQNEKVLHVIGLLHFYESVVLNCTHPL